MIKRYGIFWAIVFLSIISAQSNAQILDDFFIQQDVFYTGHDDTNLLRLGTEAGMAYEYVDYSAFINLGFIFDRTGVNDINYLLLGVSAAGKINLNHFGFRFPVLLGTTYLNTQETGFLTIVPGAQVFVGKFEKKFGIGYQYFYGPNAPLDSFNSGSISAFFQIKVFQ